MEDDKLGITLQLPAGAAEAFRGRYRTPSSESQGESESDTTLQADHHHYTNQRHQLVSLQPLSRDLDDDWNEDIAVPSPVSTDSLAETADKEDIVSREDARHVIEDDESSKEEQEEEEEDDDDDDELSLTPPFSLPVVLVNLERLVGYQPSSAEEVELLRAQVHTALWGSADEAVAIAAVSNPQEQEGDVLEPDEDDLQLASQFDERAANLFENGIARHSDTSQVLSNNTELLPNADGTYDVDDSLRFIAMEYPAYVCQGNGADPPVVLNTARVWKLLLKPHSIAVVDRLLRHLCSCSRSLLWKDSMRSELLHLAACEEDFRIRRNQSSELNLWKTARRKEQLDKLYTVRETFEHQRSNTK